jgi:transposase InsO family protein
MGKPSQRMGKPTQRMGKPTQANEMPLQAQLVVEPFKRWALDFVGPFNPPSNHKTYILVCTDYVTKWVEAMVLASATEATMAYFLFEEIFIQFGVPKEIITDGGKQFTSHMIHRITSKHNIKHRITSPYHPHANGQVESSNKVIEVILTKTLRSHHKDWAMTFQESFDQYFVDGGMLCV